MPLRTTGTLTLALGLAGLVAIHAQSPTFRSQVDAIAIDTVVVDRDGRPVEDLTAADFTLLENGKPQAISSFALVKVPDPGESGTDPQVQTNIDSDGRLYVIALGDMRAASAMKARHFLRRFVNEQVAANDLVTIVSTGSSSARRTQDFTSDRQLLLAALDSFTGGANLPLNARWQGDALRNLLESIGRIPERRKALLLVSENTLDVLDIVAGRDPSSLVDLRAMRDSLGIAMRGNVAIYPIDPAGLENVGDGGENEGGAITLTPAVGDKYLDFRTMASMTGGFAIVNSNDYQGGFEKIVRDNSSFYMLGFTSTNGQHDGKYRRLEVRVTRPGLTVRAREGYIAPGKKEPRLHTQHAVGVTFAPAVARVLEHPVEHADVPMWVRAAASPGVREGTVVVDAELDKESLEAAPGAEVELGVVAVSADGRTVRTQRERFRAEPLGASGARMRTTASLTLPPGRYSLRVAAGAVDATRAGSVLYDIDVPRTR